MKIIFTLEIDEEQLIDFIESSEEMGTEDLDKRKKLLASVAARIQNNLSPKLKKLVLNILSKNT